MDRIVIDPPPATSNDMSIVKPRLKLTQNRAQRKTQADLPWLSTIKLPWGLEVRLLNMSTSGMLVETTSKFTPGSVAEIRNHRRRRLVRRARRVSSAAKSSAWTPAASGIAPPPCSNAKSTSTGHARHWRVFRRRPSDSRTGCSSCRQTSSARPDPTPCAIDSRRGSAVWSPRAKSGSSTSPRLRPKAASRFTSTCPQAASGACCR